MTTLQRGILPLLVLGAFIPLRGSAHSAGNGNEYLSLPITDGDCELLCMECSVGHSMDSPADPGNANHGGEHGCLGPYPCRIVDHPKCSQSFASLDLHTRNELWNVLIGSDATAIRRTLAVHPDYMWLNAQRRSIQIAGCTPGTVAYNIPVDADLLGMIAD